MLNYIDFKEISKMFIDIIKYLLTAVIISSFFSGIERNMTLLYVLSSILIILLFALSILFTYFDKKIKKEKLWPDYL